MSNQNYLTLRKTLETLLVNALPYLKEMKSSILLQAYATFCSISAPLGGDFVEAYKNICKEKTPYKKSILHGLSVTDSEFFSFLVKAFATITAEDFFRFVVPDMVANPQNLAEVLEKKYHNNTTALAHHIIECKLVLYKFNAKKPMKTMLLVMKKLSTSYTNFTVFWGVESIPLSFPKQIFTNSIN